ncbi:MAG: response regulator [Acidobacteria bacterium]|nr:response regulator [Acidobacteriota bacterium]MCL5288105.1 response regulator [Acidobacteriota bacterium]
MPRLLIIDDEEAMRSLLREALQGSYDIIDTGDPVEALALALEQKPDAILLDLALAEFSGFELCQTFCSLSATQRVPIFVITGKPAAEYKDFCLNLGATEYIEKPVDITRLRSLLAEQLKAKPLERRKESRIRISIALKLKGADVSGKTFVILTATENASARGFLANCAAPLEIGTQVEVYLCAKSERYAGRARVVRTEWRDTPRQRYGFQFIEKPSDWILE